MTRLLLSACVLVALVAVGQVGVKELPHTPSGACARDAVVVWAEGHFYVCREGYWTQLGYVPGRCPVCATDNAREVGCVGSGVWRVRRGTEWDAYCDGKPWEVWYACPRCGNLFTLLEGGGDE